MVPWVTATEAGSAIEVWVVPGASRTSIDGPHGDALKVRVAAPPERGKANAALIEHFEARLGVKVLLRSGEGSRRKKLEAVGIGPREVADRLSE